MADPEDFALDEASGADLPPPSLAPPEFGSDGTPADGQRPRRKWPWVLGVAAVVSAAGIGLLYALHETVLTHDLLEADFESGAYPFLEGETEDYLVEVVNGELMISAKVESPSGRGWAFAWLARTAWLLEAEVTVVQASDSPTVGIGCLRESGGQPALDGFVFAIGQELAVLFDIASDQGVTTDAPEIEPGQRIGINCQSETVTVNQPVEGTVGGEQILELSNGDSSGFDRVVLFFFPTDADDFAAFDDVTVKVP